jgi:hypothetical protein
MSYFEDEDVLHLVISDESESDSVELSPNITAELIPAVERDLVDLLAGGGEVGADRR